MHDNISPYIMLVAFGYCWGFACGYMFKQAKQIENRTAFLNYIVLNTLSLLIPTIFIVIHYTSMVFISFLWLPLWFRKPSDKTWKNNLSAAYFFLIFFISCFILLGLTASCGSVGSSLPC